MESRGRNNEYRTTIVCVDSYKDGVPVGRFYNPYDPRGETFYGMTRFLSRMTDLLDTMDFPRSFTGERSFAASPPGPGRRPEETIQEGKVATFSLRIFFRRNSTWQGAVSWMEGGRSENFRSALELIFLMDSALREPIRS